MQKNLLKTLLNMSHRKENILLVAGALALTAFAFGGGVAVTAPKPVVTNYQRVTLPENALIGHAAIIYDPVHHEVVYQKNANQPLALASLTKLITAQAVLSANPANTPVYVSQDAVSTEGDSGLKPGETVELSQLLTLALGASSNDAIAAAAASLGDRSIEAINEEADKLFLTQSRFLNPTGLDVNATTPGAWGSAYDVARLTAAFMKDHGEFFSDTTLVTVTAQTDEGTLTASPTAEPFLDAPGLIGAKTGYTDLAGGNLVVAFDLSVGRPLIGVVLGSTREGRFSDMRTLIEAAREQL